MNTAQHSACGLCLPCWLNSVPDVPEAKNHAFEWNTPTPSPCCKCGNAPGKMVHMTRLPSFTCTNSLQTRRREIAT